MIYWAVQYSRNLELLIYLYIIGIYVITVILRPPCWCYGGGSLMQKYRESKNRVYNFLVLRYIWPFRTHVTSNFSIYRYIYIITAVLRPPCWCYGGGSFPQKDRELKEGYTCFFLFCDILYSTHATSNLSIYRYICIITGVLRPPCWYYGY